MSTSRTTTAAPREHRVELDAGRYRYLTWGDPGGPVVSLLHGRTSLVETWNEVAPALVERGYHVIALEQRGHGESPWDPRGNYNLVDFLTDYEQFVDRILQGPHALVGHSMGSCTSLVYSGRHPDAVTRLVLEDGGPIGPTVVRIVEENLSVMPTGFATWADARAHVAQSHPHLDDDAIDQRTDLSVRPGNGGYTWRADVHALLTEQHLRHDDLIDEGQWNATRDLAMPTLFLWASVPPSLVEEETVDRMVRVNERVCKVAMPTGHSIHEERLDLFLDQVVPFLGATS